MGIGLATKALATSTTVAVLVAANPRRFALYVCNEDATIAVRIGPSTVTNGGGAIGTRGLRIAAGETLPIVSGPPDKVASEAFYVISDSGAPVVSVLEVLA